ncbi:MAG: hypothetical protein KDB80_07530, partial [Planctomycetes bacterium]|nr:hypothetical protein [Planctomycetota bacterium]
MTSIKSVLLATVASVAMIPALPGQDTPSTTAENKPSVDDLIEKLGDDSFRVRKDATEQLEQLGKDAASDLRIAAEDHDDPEVRMRATRILHRIEQGDAAPSPSPGLGDPLRARRGIGPMPGFDHDTLRSMIDEMLNRRLGPQQRLLDRLLQDADVDVGINGVEANESVKIQVGPDGVRVEVGENGDSKVYEADDMDAFRKEFPDVAKKYFDTKGSKALFRGGLRPFQWDDDDMFQQFHVDPDLTLPQIRRGARVLTPVAPVAPDVSRIPSEGRRLGVQV